jgi:hypothetical protein
MRDPRQAEIVPGVPFKRQRSPFCEACRHPLTGKQRRFCSDACRAGWWQARHPRIGLAIEPAESRPKEPIRTRILALLSDGRWYTVREIAVTLGVLETTASAKLRDLRKCPRCWRHCKRHPRASFEINHKVAARPWSNRAHEFRLVLA